MPVFVGVAIALVMVAAAVALVVRDLDSGPPHPDEWDERVVDLAAYVEEARGLEFDHPVFVDFLSPEEYTEEVTTDEESLADEDREDLDRYAGQLRALGVASGELDLFTAYNQVSDSGTLAFYDPVEQRVRVRGTDVSVGLRVTLVHELTHALQDQHFDLERLYDDDLEEGAAVAYRALVEGDALRIEETYIGEELSGDDQAAYDDEYAGQVEESQADLADVPPFVSASFGVPYAFGQPLVVMIANDGGNTAVDEAFRDPPTTEEHLFDPASFLAGERAEEVDLDLDDDVDVLEDGPFGTPAWYLVLAERIDPKVAFEAALGWSGDAFAAFERDGRSCLRAVFAGDTRSDDAEMARALADWRRALPGDQAEVIEVDGHPGVEACDPGPDIDLQLTGRAEDALYVPTLWGYLVADAATQVEADAARCYAGEVLDGLTYDQITDPEGAFFATEAFQQLAVSAYETCI